MRHRYLRPSILLHRFSIGALTTYSLSKHRCLAAEAGPDDREGKQLAALYANYLMAVSAGTVIADIELSGTHIKALVRMLENGIGEENFVLGFSLLNPSGGSQIFAPFNNSAEFNTDAILARAQFDGPERT